MTPSILIDLLICAVLGFSMFFGWRKGIVRGILSFVVSVVAIMAASWIADFTADLLIDHVIRPATHAVIQQRISELDTEKLVIAPVDEITGVIEGIENLYIREKALVLLSAVDLPVELIETSAQDTVLAISTDLVDSVLYGALHALLCALICLLCFLLISFALRPVQGMIEEFFELPILKQLNQLGGLIFGTARGVLLVLIATWGLRTAEFYITDEIVEASYLLKQAITCLESLGFCRTLFV